MMKPPLFLKQIFYEDLPNDIMQAACQKRKKGEKKGETTGMQAIGKKQK
jgi:hypothetical protein